MKKIGVSRVLRPAWLAIVVIVVCATIPNRPADTSPPDFSEAALLDPPSIVESGEPRFLKNYRIDAGKSRFRVKTGSSGIFSAFAHDHNIAISDFSGATQITEGAVEPASLQLSIKANSLKVADKVNESDRQSIESTMRDKVLETGRFPEIVFRSTSINVNRTGDGQYKAKIFGDLSLHGVTRNGMIYADVTINDGTLRARGAFPLRLSDYQMKPPSVAGGTIKVKNEIKLNFDIVAVRQ